MRDKLLEYAVITPLYWLLRLMRLIFLGSDSGAKLHNRIYFKVFKLLIRHPEHARKIRVFETAMRGTGPKIVEWQQRMYTSCEPMIRHMLKLIIRKFCSVPVKRWFLARQGQVVPTMVMVSPNTPDAGGCNLSCTTCYAKGHQAVNLPEAIFRKLMTEQEGLGIYTVLIAGGEPFLYKPIWRILESYPRTHFYVTTNGTLLGRNEIDRIAKMGNVFLMFSIDGFEAKNDIVRGPGVFKKIVQAMSLCQSRNLPFGATITVTRSNYSEVTSREFLQFLDEHRCCAVNYSCYVPTGRDPHPDWQVSVRESMHLEEVAAMILRTYPMLTTVGHNGQSNVVSCGAARGYFHVIADGRVESCPFVPYASDLNVRDHSILEIANSRFFAGIRDMSQEALDRGLPGITPCHAPKLITLRQGFAELEAKSTII